MTIESVFTVAGGMTGVALFFLHEETPNKREQKIMRNNRFFMADSLWLKIERKIGIFAGYEQVGENQPVADLSDMHRLPV